MSRIKEVKILQKVDGKWVDLELNDDLTEEFEQILDQQEREDCNDIG